MLQYIDKIKNLSELEEGILLITTLEFEEKGYHLANVDDIASKLKIGKGTIYRHFGNKQDLFFCCLAYKFAERFRRLSIIDSIECPYEAVNFSLDSSFQAIENMSSKRGVNDLLTQAHIVAKDELELSDFIISLLERSIIKTKSLIDRCVKKSGKDGIDTALVSEYIVSTIGVFFHTHNKFNTSDKKVSAKEYDSIKRFILRGIGIDDKDIDIVLLKSNKKIKIVN